MTKITLEDGAQYIAQEGKSVTGYEARLADLIRAAQKVVDSASGIRLKATSAGQVAVIGGKELREALTAFRKLEEGE